MKLRIIISVLILLTLAGCDQIRIKSPKSVTAPVVEEEIQLPETVSFNEHIQPILAEYCYHCHGADAKTRKPKNNPLRLDSEQGIFALRSDGRPVILRGNPQESRLYQLMTSPDPDSVMPPPKSHKTVKKAELSLIRLWIEQGAEIHEVAVPNK